MAEISDFHPGEGQGRIQACARDGREQGRIALPQRYPLTVAVDRWPGPLTVDRGGDAGPGVASRQAGAMRGLQRGGLAGREQLPVPVGADTTAALERRITASFRAATSGQRSTAPVYGQPPRNSRPHRLRGSRRRERAFQSGIRRWCSSCSSVPVAAGPFPVKDEPAGGRSLRDP